MILVQNVKYAVQVTGFLEAWIQGSQSVAYTPSGLAYLSPWGSLRHTGNAAFIATLYAQLIASKPLLASLLFTILRKYSHAKNSIQKE